MAKAGTKCPTKTGTAGTVVITRGSQVSGELNVAGHIHIDGTVQGKIHCSDYIIIGRKACVQGTIITQKLYIAGTFNGSIFSAHLELYKTAKIIAKINCPLMLIEPGARINAEKNSEYQYSEFLDHFGR